MQQTDSVVRLERDGDAAILVVDNPPVNAGSAAVRRGLLQAVEAFGRDPSLAFAIVIGAGKTFIAGSDLKEFGGPLEQPELPAVIAAIETCAKPVIAAIHGAALGGGFELTLGCDGRIAAPDAVVGLPEVSLGMIPGAGGTQRLPRLVGLAAAIELIVSARRVPAPEALALGMIDRIASGPLRAEAIAFGRSLAGEKRRLRDRILPSSTEAEVAAAADRVLKKARGAAPRHAVMAIRQAQSLSFDAALADERRIFQQLRTGEEAAALRHLFFAERDVMRLALGATENVKKVGIVGAGTMGTGIAVAFADAGFEVVLADTDQAALARAKTRIDEIYARAASSGRLPAAAAEAARRRISSAGDLAALSGCDLAVEAVFEDMAVKRDVLSALDRLLPPAAILASNTSYLDLDQLAAATNRPDKVVGLHFFSPANVMRLLEVVEGARTAPQTATLAFALARKLRKIPVPARVGEGFIANRIYNAYRVQCEFLLEEGALPQEVDTALEQFGFAMGPFATWDLAGLDIAWRMRRRLAETRDPRIRYVDLLDRLCEAGRFGRKTGQGWYAYPPDAKKGIPDDAVRQLIADASRRKDSVRRPIGKDEIVARALGAILNEAALVLADGIARSAADIDLVMVHGYGFPAHRGGPLFWASRRPQSEIETALAQVERACGFGFRRGPVERVLNGLKEEANGSRLPAPPPPPPAFRE